jgi:hypothetical protein
MNLHNFSGNIKFYDGSQSERFEMEKAISVVFNELGFIVNSFNEADGESLGKIIQNITFPSLIKIHQLIQIRIRFLAAKTLCKVCFSVALRVSTGFKSTQRKCFKSSSLGYFFRKACRHLSTAF